MFKCISFIDHCTTIQSNLSLFHGLRKNIQQKLFIRLKEYKQDICIYNKTIFFFTNLINISLLAFNYIGEVVEQLQAVLQANPFLQISSLTFRKSEYLAGGPHPGTVLRPSLLNNRSVSHIQHQFGVHFRTLERQIYMFMITLVLMKTKKTKSEEEF